MLIVTIGANISFLSGRKLPFGAVSTSASITSSSSLSVSIGENLYKGTNSSGRHTYSEVLGGIVESISVLRHMLPRVARPCTNVCVSSVTLVHPAKAVGRNEIPFGRNTCEVPSNLVLDSGHSPRGKGKFRGRNPSQNLHCKLWPNRYT